MTIQRFQTTERSSQAVSSNGLIFLAGQVARDKPYASVADQTRNVLDRIDALLNATGSDRSHLINATIWLADIRAFAEMNAVWVGWLPAGAAPARAVVESRLAYPEFAVEIAIVAARR